MSPGRRPSHPLPTPDQRRIPAAVITIPTITSNFPSSLISLITPCSFHLGQLLKTLFDERCALDARQFRIQPVSLQQFLVRALFHDFPGANHEDLAGFADRA